MSTRSGASRVRQHVHCDSCYSRRCRARVEVSVSCALMPCRLLCGALFHLCKEEDHLLLCPNVRVPCLNADYGCPIHLPRSSQAAHLQECPASVVSCSMEWLRWPNDETHPHHTMALQQNVMKEDPEDLDLAMAVVDQADLYRRLKMKPLFPELMEEEEEEEEIKNDETEEMAEGGLVNGIPKRDTTEASSSCANNVAEEPAQSSEGRLGEVDKDRWERISQMMFGMDKRQCDLAMANKDKPKEPPKPEEKVKTPKQDSTENKGAAAPPRDTGKTGHAPWDEGVLERLGKELTPQEYNMYIVHHGRMLVTFGQMQACTPREKDFVYGSLEPIPVQTLRSFKVPDSYHYRQRVHHVELAARAQYDNHYVDTSDLGCNEEDWFTDEAESTLLGYADEAVMGHKISQMKSMDGLFVDMGTQTHSFRSAPYKRTTTLAEVVADRPVKLILQLQADTVNSRNNKCSCAFTFVCGHTFHRREYGTHFRNVHSDIQMSLNGWFEQRCPLAYLGCTYRHRRFHPSTYKATVSYNQQLKAFNLRPTLVASLGDDSQPTRSTVDSSGSQRRRARRTGGGEFSFLDSLPYEVLCHMATFLDSLSLSQLALVSRLMRQVVSTLLQDRGMVTLRWEKKTYSHGGAKWRAKPVWEFSPLFSSVDSWHMADLPSISAHLKVCPYYETSPHSERVPLPSMTEKKGSSQERLSLVHQFTGNRQQQ